MSGDLGVSHPVCDGAPLGPASPKSVVGQKACGSEISPIKFAWITAQWAWRQQRQKSGNAERLAVTMTFLMPHEIGTQQRPHQITFYLTNRLREFQATNELQQQVLTMAALRQERWIGKARIRQTPNKRREDHHRRNIPDLVMTAHIQDGDNPHILATLYTLDQQIELAFTEPLTMAQQKHYEGAAVWGRVVKRSRPADDFHDWLKYA